MRPKLLFCCLLLLILSGCIWPERSPNRGIEVNFREEKPSPGAFLPPAEAGEEAAVSGAAYHPEAKKVVYLTFDDGPSRHFTPRVLDILARYQVKATFMVVGVNIPQNRDVVQRIIVEGHALGNHTYSHDYKKIYRSPDAFVQDLRLCGDLLQEFTGRPVKIFRAPGGPGNLSPTLKQLLKQLGYHSVGWNVTGDDANPHGASAEHIYRTVMEGVIRVEKTNAAPVILLHDGADLHTLEAPPNSALARYIETRKNLILALPKIIESLRARGYTFAVVDEKTPGPR